MESLLSNRAFCEVKTSSGSFKMKQHKLRTSGKPCVTAKNKQIPKKEVYKVGHSFAAADRDFALKENRWKVSKAEVVEDVKSVILSARPSKPFKVLDMGGKFLDFDKAAASVINTTKLNITKVAWLRVHSDSPGTVKVKKTFSEIEDWKSCKIVYPGMNANNISSAIFESSVPIPTSKKDYLRKMLPFAKHF